MNAGNASTALVVGGGIGGMSAAIMLRGLGWRVDLIDIDPEWKVYGAGISVTRPTMRAFKRLGVIDEIKREGYAGDGILVCTPEGLPVSMVRDPVLDDPDVPGSGGIMRPVLHRILSDRVRGSGARVRLGLTVEALAQDGSRVDVRFSDGASGRYDLVVGADGLFSRVRSMIVPDAPKPEYTGQYIWRLFAPRPPEIVRRHFFLGGPVKVGLAPVSQRDLYLFMLESRRDRVTVPDAEAPERMRTLLAGYGGVVGKLRDDIGPGSPIIVRPLEAFHLPPPWLRGRVVLIGDAAHPTTPHLASGAGIAVEDAIVLAEELERSRDVPGALAAWMERRWRRCRLVVENSLEIGRLEQAGMPPAAQTALLEQSLAKLAEPI